MILETRPISSSKRFYIHICNFTHFSHCSLNRLAYERFNKSIQRVKRDLRGILENNIVLLNFKEEEYRNPLIWWSWGFIDKRIQSLDEMPVNDVILAHHRKSQFRQLGDGQAERSHGIDHQTHLSHNNKEKELLNFKKGNTFHMIEERVWSSEKCKTIEVMRS